ncbi:hypothetical protein M8J76_012089 [Diaphorina citri]|nr:hypothetical protein M8J76_012089 [Diaphorina citri]
MTSYTTMTMTTSARQHTKKLRFPSAQSTHSLLDTPSPSAATASLVSCGRGGASSASVKVSHSQKSKHSSCVGRNSCVVS